MGGACGTCGGRVNLRSYLVGKPVRKRHLQDLVLSGRIVLKEFLRDRMGR